MIEAFFLDTIFNLIISFFKWLHSRSSGAADTWPVNRTLNSLSNKHFYPTLQ